MVYSIKYEKRGSKNYPSQFLRGKVYIFKLLQNPPNSKYSINDDIKQQILTVWWHGGARSNLIGYFRTKAQL